MVLSSISSSRRRVLTCSAVVDLTRRSKWQRHGFYRRLHPTTAATYVLVILLAACAGTAFGNAPNVYRDLPARISYFMEDGLKLNCSVLLSPKSHSLDSVNGDGRGKFGTPTQINWYKVEDDGKAKELRSDKRFVLSQHGQQLEIKPIHSQHTELKVIKGGYFCQATNTYGTTRSRTCVINPVSSAISGSNVVVQVEVQVMSGLDLAVLHCKVNPEYAHPYYRIVGWRIAGMKSNMITKSTSKYSVVNSIYPYELHIRHMNNEDRENKYFCVVESTIYQSKYPIRNTTYESKPVKIPEPPDKGSVSTPFLMIAHRAATVKAPRGTSIELPCVYIFSTKVNYQWYRNNELVYPLKGKKEWSKKYVVLDPSYGNLLITDLNENDVGTYECRGIYGSGELSSQAGRIALNITSPIGVTVTPRKQNIDYKSTATMQCHVQGRPLSRVYWLHNGKRVLPSANIHVSNTPNHTLTIKRAERETGGVFQCFAESGTVATPMDNAQSRTVVTIVKMPPQLVAQYPQLQSGETRGHVLLGTVNKQSKAARSVRLRCDFEGHPEPRITWYRDDVRIPLSGNVIKLANSPWKDLYIDMAQAYQKSDGNLARGVEYGGEYTAVAVNQHGKAKCRIFVEVDAEMTIRKFPKELSTPIEGQDYRLKCYVLGRGTFKGLTIKWVKKDSNGVVNRLPNNHRHKIEENGRTLLIKNVKKEEDDGTYTCTARSSAGNARQAVKLDVSRQPVINSFNQRYHVDEGIDKVTVTCNIKNQADEPWYAWWEFMDPKTKTKKVLRDSRTMDGVRITYSKKETYSQRPEIDVPAFVRANTWVMLEIDRPEKSKHTGNYTCIITNKVGTSKSSVSVTFKPKIKFDVKPPSNQVVILSNQLTLNCSASISDPKPIVEWKYFDQQENSYKSVRRLETKTADRIRQYSNGTLVVRNISRSDPKQYMCYVSLNVSDAEAISQVVTVKVHYPAFIQPIANHEQKVGESFNISCHVDGDGEIKTEWMFFNENTKTYDHLAVPCFANQDQTQVAIPCETFATAPNQIPNLFRIKFRPKSGQGVIHRLSFTKVTEDNQGNYRCRARNKYNKLGNYAQRNVKLTVIGKPGRPENLKSSHYTATSIRFTWQKPAKNGNKPILLYRITYCRIRDLTILEETRRQINISATPSKTTYEKEIAGLHPAYEYRLEVSAINAVGSSPTAHITQRTREAKPSGKVQNITANGTNSDTIHISWLPPPLDKRNGRLTHYQVCLRAASSDSNDSDKVPTDDVHWTPCRDIKANSHHVDGGGAYNFNMLPKFTKYFIRVVAVNSKGRGPAEYSFARTLEDVPREPPTSVTCTPGPDVVLMWNPPNMGSMNGILTGYAIRYFETNDFEDESSSVILNVSSATSMKVQNLEKYTNYTFRISAVNSKGSGPPSDPITCLTSAAKPDPPNGVKVLSLNSSCLAVSWRHPKHSNGRLEAYNILYMPMEYGGPKKDKSVVADLSGRFQYHYICELENNLRYKVQVQAKNHASYVSDFTRPQNATTMSEPPARILAFDEDVRTNDAVDVKLSCLHVGYEPVTTSWTRHSNSGEEAMGEEPVLVLKKIKADDGGTYRCEVRNYILGGSVEDTVTYKVDVRAPPNRPRLSGSRQRLHSLEVTWRPTGSARYRLKDLAITRYWLTYFNLFTKERRTVGLHPSNRTFFLSNLTCATKVVFSIKAENAVGNSSESLPARMVTKGLRPVPDDTKKLRSQNPHTFNYLNLTAVFGPGEGCMPLDYRLWVVPREGNYADVSPVRVRARDLENQCCYNLTNLNAGSRYKYILQAHNAAGSVNISGEFVTLTKAGKMPLLDDNHKTANSNFWERPHILIGLIFVLVVLVAIVLAGGLLWRRRITCERMRESEKGPVNQCVNDLKGDEGKPETGLRHQFISPQHIGLPTQSRIRVPRNDEEEDRLSNDGSVDSDGNINPYATFATYESNTIDRHELPDGGPRELGAVERESGRMRERMSQHNSQKRKRQQHYYDSHGMPKQYENESVPGTLNNPMGAKRRSNSLEDLDSTAYNRGYATGGGGQMGRSFYESKYTDQQTPYRGSSVISSTTMSSNHDELSQAYEYGRRARMESGLNTNEIFPEDNLDLHTGSGSSETTDPGIRQFTQQPPMPDEQRQATCEVPLFSNQRRTSLNPSETYEAVDEAYYKRGVQRQPMNHPARQVPLPDLPPLSATTLGRPRFMSGHRGAPPQFRNRSDSDSVYGPGHVYDSTDSYYSSYTPSNFGRRMPAGPGGEFPRHTRQMPSSRYYNGGGPSERHPLVAGAGPAAPAAPRPLLYGAPAMPGADPDEARSLLMNRRYSGGNRGGDSGVGSSGGGFSSSSIVPSSGRRPSRPLVSGAGARPEPSNPNLLGAAAAPGPDSDSETENIYTSEFTVV